MENPLADITHDGPRVTVALHDREVDTDELRNLFADLRDLLQTTDARTFVFCFEKVEFLPSACLALLLMFYQDVKRSDGRVVLLNCQENVAFLLRLARLDALFELARGTPADV